ncbi:hypothetical protein MLD38_007632 [Melastoma candidum]|uniref:Uncharacterized protein n=1 Tax=Melastoma candidum TaxID=119954 RepID=A0ACB9RQW7_9MYRT|nr:hypothetical protein MLD38_007632 [Melastoma candidum]
MAMEVSMCSSSGWGTTDLSPEEERILVKDLALAAEAATKEGDTFYLLSQRWWQNWIEYVNQDHQTSVNDGSSLSEICDSVGSTSLRRPGLIDNSILISEPALEGSRSNIEIHDTLLEGRDYVLLPHEVWNQLHSWYGGGPMLPRKAICSGLSQTELTVEVYPLRLHLLLMPNGDRSTIRISKKETVGDLHRRACEIFDLSSEQVCIWDYYGRRKHALMNDMDRTLDDSNIQMDQDILVEIIGTANGGAGGGGLMQGNGSLLDDPTVLADPSKPSLGGFPAGKISSRSYNTELSPGNTGVHGLENTSGVTGVSTRGSSCGLTGLVNLGNTCFMNSAIQCLVHTPEFAKYFREDYHREINWHNPLGMVGELALAFGELLRKLWAPGRMPVAPRQFKARLARFAPQFSGYNQHDSQELLAFLLDGLHEDLNRVKHKPYIKSRDADGRPDEEVADEYWANHIARNDSIIVDVCQGQYKSTLVCPVCNKISVTFDPFMYLSLPLQSTASRTMTVTVLACDGSALPCPYTLTVPKQGRCRDLLQALSIACQLQPTDKLLLAEVQGHLIHRMFNDPLTLLSTIKDDDCLCAYKISKLKTNHVYLHLVHHIEEQITCATQTSRMNAFGTPLVVPIPRSGETKCQDIQAVVLRILSPMLKEKESGQGDIPGVGHSVAAWDQTTDSVADMEQVDTNSQKEDGRIPEHDPSLPLPLKLVDEHGVCIDLSIKGKVIRMPSSSCKLVMDWSEDLLSKYDTGYLENLPEVLKNMPAPKKSRSEPLSLYTCLEAFLREEPLVPEDMWYCPKCKERRQASKKLDLWRLPEVLVIHLKRFSYSRSMKHKLETFVNFPIHDFDLTNYIANKNNYRRQLYELYALTNHYGGMGSGHYTAYIKLLEENRWYNFDDSHISPISEDDVKSAAAYVLFYRRVRDKDGSLSNGNRPS